MRFTIKVDQEQFTRALRAAPDAVRKEIYTALGVSVRTVELSAKSNHKFRTKSGQLERSIVSEVRQDGLYAETRLEESISDYGKYQHDGTRPHRIYPRNKKALHFVSGGVPWFVPKRPFISGRKNPFWAKLENEGSSVSWKGYVNHPGIKADQFLYRAFNKQVPSIIKRMDAALESAYRKGGL